MHVKVSKNKTILLLIVSFLLNLMLFTYPAYALTSVSRDEMISIAGPYTKVPWSLVEPNNSTKKPIGAKYSIREMYGSAIYRTKAFEKGKYTGMAYNYGGVDKIGKFLEKIKNKYMPRSQAGIDCSAYVSWIWKIPRQTTIGLAGDTYASWSPTWSVSKGDIYNRPTDPRHAVLVYSGPYGKDKNQYRIYQAAGSPHKVEYKSNWVKKSNDGYSPRRRKEPITNTQDTKAPSTSKLAPTYNGMVFWGSSYTLKYRGGDSESDYTGNGRGDVSDYIGIANGPKQVDWYMKAPGKNKSFERITQQFWGTPKTWSKKVWDKNKKEYVTKTYDKRDYSYNWKFGNSSFKQGEHTFKVKAYDWNGNSAYTTQPIKIVKRAKYSRIRGRNAYYTNKNIATTGWPSGSKNIIIVRADQAYEAVLGAGYAKKLGAPILINQGGEKGALTSTVKGALTTLNARKTKVKYIYIIGGPKAISSKVVTELNNLEKDIKASWTIKRVYGSNANTTSIKVAKTMGNPKTIFLANREFWGINVASASGAAYKGYSFIYIDKKDDIPTSAVSYMNSYGINKVYVIGKTNAITNGALDEIEKEGRSIERLGAKLDNNRDMSQSIADRFWKLWDSDNYIKPARIVLSNMGMSNLAYSYGGLAYAAKSKSPLLLVQKQGELKWFKVREKIVDKRKAESNITLLGEPAITNYYFRRCSNETNYPTLALLEDDNIYTAQSKDSEIIGRALEDQRYVPVNPYELIDEEEREFYKIYFAGRTGYVSAESVQDIIGDRVVEILTDSYVYELPELDDELIVGEVLESQKYVAPIDEDGWAGIYYDGDIAYIPPNSFKVVQLGPEDKVDPDARLDFPSYVKKATHTLTISVDEPLSDEGDGLTLDINDSSGNPISYRLVSSEEITEAIDEEPVPDDEEIEEDEEDGDPEIIEDETLTESFEIIIPDEEEVEEETIINEDELEETPTDSVEIIPIEEDEESEDSDEIIEEIEEEEQEEVVEEKIYTDYIAEIYIDESTAQGDATINVRAKDMVGNTSEATKTFVVDLSAPETKVIPKIEPYLSEDGKLYTNKDNTFLIDPEDRYSGVENLFVSINNSSYQSFDSKINITFKEERIYKIKYYATDKVGNTEEEKTYQIIIDNTPPESTISADLINENFEVIPETLFTIQSTDKGKYPSGLATVEYRIDEEAFKEYTPFMLKGKENGIHTITYRATDNAGNIEEQKTFVVNLKDAISVSLEDKTPMRRTAVWLNVNEEEKPLVNREKLESLLMNNNNYIYKITDSREQFIQDLKSNLYTSYIILGNQLKLTDHEAAKLREQIFIGKTIISSLFTNIDEAPKPKTSSEFDEIFGVKHVGSLPSSNHEISLDENLNIDGKAIRYEANNHTEKIGSIDNTDYPAIIKNTFGKGKTYLFAFDLINNLNNQKIIEIMNTSLEETNPTVETLPLSPKVFELNIKANVVLLTSQIDTIGSNAISYIPENYPYLINTTLDEQEIKLILRYPDENNSIFNINTGYYARGELISYRSFTFEETIDKTKYQLIDELINEFDNYISINDDSKIKLARDFLITLKVNSTTLTNDQIVHELLKIIKDVIARDDLSSKTRENLSKLVVVYCSY